MSATLNGSASSLTFGIGSDESGMTVRSFRVKSQIKRKDVPTLQGETGGFALYDPTQNIAVAGAMKATGTFATAAIAAAITLTNSANSGGITTGLVILMDMELAKEVENFVEGTFNLFRAPLVTA